MTKKSQKKYVLTEEHKAQLKPWADKWIKNAMSTEPMTDLDKEIMRRAITEMYAAAKSPPPRIVFVPSPFVACFATGFASAIWYLRRSQLNTTWAATEAATWDATRAATEAATW